MIDGPNLYVYLNNNPINDIDPWGLCGGAGGGFWSNLWDKIKDWWKKVSDWFQGRVPEYGNYGGPGNTDPTYNKEPIDQMDSYFREHDRGWEKGRGDKADHRLYEQLRNLPRDPSKWNPAAPDPQRAQYYRNLAESYFRHRTEYLESRGR